jgi:Protease inhibitor Inh
MTKDTARTSRLIASVVACAFVLAACASDRIDGPRLASSRSAPPAAMSEPSVTAIPADPVTSEPLPPPPGSPAPSAPAPVIADVPVMGGSPAPIQTAPPQIAAIEPQAVPGTTRASAVGAWTAREASGTSCRVQLSSTPSLDLYKASASGCGNKDLARVTAWDFRNGEVYLYQPGGAVAARLRTSSGSLEGVLAKSGAPLTLSRS